MTPTQGFPEQHSSEVTDVFVSGEPYDFSLILGGPFFQFVRKAYLSGDVVKLIRWRVFALCTLAWLPLLLLVIFTGGRAGLLSFFDDIEVHVRLLVALPILFAGELFVHSRIRSTVRGFVDRRLIPPDAVSLFEDAIGTAVRWRNSIAVQVALLILVYGVGLWHWGNRVVLATTTWYSMPGGRWNLTPAGYWYVLVSIPIVQFVLLCWYWRFIVWSEFLWKVSRIRLNLVSTHPDHCAGLGFLGRSAYAFAPILFAQGAMLAGVVATRVLERGESLTSFKVQIAGFITFFVLAVLGPLMVFSPQIAATRRKGLGIYGRLAQDYVEGFEQKWEGRGPASEDLLGSADIQSLADLSNSYSIVGSMRMFPFGLTDITRLLVVTAAPFAPLLLTVFSFEELVVRVFKAIF